MDLQLVNEEKLGGINALIFALLLTTDYRKQKLCLNFTLFLFMYKSAL